MRLNLLYRFLCGASELSLELKTIFRPILDSRKMIHSLRRTKWHTLVKISTYPPTQFSSVSSLERSRFWSTLVSDQDKSSSESWFSMSDLIASAPKSDIGRLQSSKKPELVLKFLKESGFSQSQIKSIVYRRPLILVSDPVKTLKPKMDFFFSIGISKDDFVRIVSDDPLMLTRSVEKHMIPLFDFLKDAVGSEENAARAVRKCPHVFRSSIRKSLELNTSKLLDAGFPKDRVALLIMHQLRGIAQNTSRFENALTMVKELGFKPTEPAFGLAVAAIGWCSKLAWEDKMEQFRRFGLSDSEIVAGFKKQPTIMLLKSDNMKAKMNFFLKGMHWSPRKVMMAPYILMPSLEKRIIPRLTVLYLLVSQGDLDDGEFYSALCFLKIPKEKFVEKYVFGYKDRIPQILDAHEGKLKIEDLHTLNASAVFVKNEYWSGT